MAVGRHQRRCSSPSDRPVTRSFSHSAAQIERNRSAPATWSYRPHGRVRTRSRTRKCAATGQAGRPDEAGEQAVAELDPLVGCGDVRMWLRHQAARETLWPARAAQARAGHPHHRAGHRHAPWVIAAAIAVARDGVASERFGAGTTLMVGNHCACQPTATSARREPGERTRAAVHRRWLWSAHLSLRTIGRCGTVLADRRIAGAVIGVLEASIIR